MTRKLLVLAFVAIVAMLLLSPSPIAQAGEGQGHGTIMTAIPSGVQSATAPWMEGTFVHQPKTALYTGPTMVGERGHMADLVPGHFSLQDKQSSINSIHAMSLAIGKHGTGAAHGFRGHYTLLDYQAMNPPAAVQVHGKQGH